MNEERFTGKSKAYSKFRPSYPKEFLNYLYSEVGFSEKSVVADIGSGTGIFTKQLLKKGSTVFAVEPNEDMRKTAEEDLKEYSGFFSIPASAENTGLENSSVDFVTVAQAFHWFDTQKFKTECKRILKPQGKIILVWNSRNDDSVITKENEKIDIEFCKNFKGYSGGISGPLQREKIAQFFDNKFELKVFENPLVYDRDGFIGRNLSSSYAPKGGEENYEEYISALSDMFDKFSTNGVIEYPFYTQSYVGNLNF